MSPIDDELRAALQGRAQVVTPTPDPLAGIEQRAKKIQRTRIGAAVAGSALAVALVAAVVPAVQNATASRNDVPGWASAQPTAPAPATSAYALDPENPWDYRGVPQEQLGTGTIDTIQRDYATLRRSTDKVVVTPLFGRSDEPSRQTEVVFLAEVDGSYRWGVAQSSDGGPVFLVDEALPSPAMALAAALPGDEGIGRLVVVADPAVDEMSYAEDGSGSFRTMTPLDDGVGIIALTGDSATHRYSVSVSGEEIHGAPAPDVTVERPEADPDSPGTALDPDQPWELRGDASLVDDADLRALAADWADRRAVSADDVTVVPLFVQTYESAASTEVVYLVRAGDGPWSWAVSGSRDGGWQWYAEHELEPGTEALVAALPGDEVERLLVVAAPWAGGAVYAGDGQDFEPMTDIAMGVFISPIEGDPAADRYKVLDGNGDLDDPITEGDVPAYQNAG